MARAPWRCTDRALDRRSFVRRATAALVAGALAPLPACRTVAPGSRWQIGCYTRPWDQHDYRVALDAIAEAGFRYAGIMTAKGKSWVIISAETSLEAAADVGTEVRRRGLRTASVYGDFKPTADVASNVRALSRLVGHCAACGSPDLLLGGTGEASLHEPYYRAIAEVCPEAQSRGVRLTIKPHGGRNATGPQCREAIEGVRHPNFRLWYDPGNIYYYSDGALDPVADAATVDGLVVGMSVKDFLPPKEVMVTPGTGRVDFAGVLRRLGAGGFRGGPLVVECLARGDGQDVRRITAQAVQARQFLESLISGLA
ncbi:MAG TPA: TIM barrel protein [Verrucomicrobiota bacterium]|nr:TIM barrel protein [Verrucomicrobiota bacterium]HNU52703.1 TIM barrel protein [Verrucomicrobiota bacterium]